MNAQDYEEEMSWETDNSFKEFITLVACISNSGHDSFILVIV